ncbi:MAG: hypothetical protein ACXABX_01130 [Candidatus Thorarchaeota archaeon]|jgi:hypothetical protein
MKNTKTKLLLGGIILALGIILMLPVQADTPEETVPKPHLYYYDEETGEYVPVYPPWYDPENPESYTPPENCPWWDSNGDGGYDWMPHWGRRWNNPDTESWENDSLGGYRRGGCGGYGSRGGGYRPS